MFGKRPDSDAPKKATTDGVTKALAQLGFNADVFLKKFDDNKYVAELRAEKAQTKKPEQQSNQPSEREAAANAHREARTEGLTVALHRSD